MSFRRGTMGLLPRAVRGGKVFARAALKAPVAAPEHRLVTKEQLSKMQNDIDSKLEEGLEFKPAGRAGW